MLTRLRPFSSYSLYTSSTNTHIGTGNHAGVNTETNTSARHPRDKYIVGCCRYSPSSHSRRPTLSLSLSFSLSFTLRRLPKTLDSSTFSRAPLVCRAIAIVGTYCHSHVRAIGSCACACIYRRDRH